MLIQVSFILALKAEFFFFMSTDVINICVYRLCNRFFFFFDEKSIYETQSEKEIMFFSRDADKMRY